MAKDPLGNLHQTAVHQLERAAEHIEDGDGIVSDFDYDQETWEYYTEMPGVDSEPEEEREVTLEVTYLLPE